MKHKTRIHSGFTLIEAIAAIVVLAVAVPPMLWSIQDSQVSRVAPILASRARWLATEKLEDIIADRHSTTRGYGYVVAANYPAEPSVAGMAGFSRSVSITETGAAMASGGTGYKLVTVTVGWIDARARARSLSLSTVVTDY
ncbi:MAG: prepilin-type N-terminal cleavage/methylation domain-containing protein [Phycisphaerales bacterium]|nr:prepilin-type N-terminal cleavage/methylation domain-containing protein [Phycisphaerales bacterium]